MELPRIPVSRRTGDELFVSHGLGQQVHLLEFWQWYASDLVSNATRGILAEFIVAMALGEHHGVRLEWDSFDIETSTGIRIEVKSAAYVQSWHQHDYSRLQFSVRPTRLWSAETRAYCKQQRRQADIYVFALLHHKDQTTINPLDLSQWTFYVLATELLNQQLSEAKSLSLKRLESLNPVQCDFDGLYRAVHQVHAACSTASSSSSSFS